MSVICATMSSCVEIKKEHVHSFKIRLHRHRPGNLGAVGSFIVVLDKGVDRSSKGIGLGQCTSGTGGVVSATADVGCKQVV